MNFREQLLSEMSRKNIDYIIHVVGDNPEYFDELIRMILYDHDPVPPRASWAAEGISRNFPRLADKYVYPFVEGLPYFTHPGTRRNVLKMLSRMPIPEELQGTLIDLCFKWMTGEEEPVAVKVFCMDIVARHLGMYPDLRFELREVIEDQYSRSSAGFQAHGRKVLKQISAIE